MRTKILAGFKGQLKFLLLTRLSKQAPHNSMSQSKIPIGVTSRNTKAPKLCLISCNLKHFKIHLMKIYLINNECGDNTFFLYFKLK